MRLSTCFATAEQHVFPWISLTVRSLVGSLCSNQNFPEKRQNEVLRILRIMSIFYSEVSNFHAKSIKCEKNLPTEDETKNERATYSYNK